MNPILAKWYAAHPAVRRLWAISEAQGMRVVVMLEPTRDGDDIYPAWLANGRDWARELQVGLGESVQLQVMDGPSPAWVDRANGVLVAELSWRDAGSDDTYMSGVALRPLPATPPTSRDRKLEP